MNALLQPLRGEAATAVEGVQRISLPTGVMELKVDAGPFRLDDLIGFAARANTKRGFLFLSKVLGKHWPVTPRLMHDIHTELAAQVPADLPGPVIFIAMAETAIGLGQGVFEAYQAAHPEREALFLHQGNSCTGRQRRRCKVCY